jgi:hypothetical protein
MDLIPWEAMVAVAQVLEFGRVKYAKHNWRKGFEWTRLISAALRHIFSWLSGEDLDPESGLNHLAHACCDLMFAIAHVVSDLGKDDRACKLLGEGAADIKAPIVLVHTKTRYQVWYRGGTGEWPSATDGHVGINFVSREIAQRAIDNTPHEIDKPGLFIKEVEER